MPTIITKGAKTAQGYGFASKVTPAVVPNYIEDVFSTYLYTGNGNGTTGGQTITNNINLSSNGGMVWIKARNIATDHDLFDTSRGVYKYLISNNTDAQHTASTTNLTAFNTNGFTLGPDSTGNVNSNDNGAGSACTYASWTFRKQTKFFDVVTYTGTGSLQTISHSLGSTPGMIIVKQTSASGQSWLVYHNSLNGGVNPENYGIYLDRTSASFAYANGWTNPPTSTNFTVGSSNGINASGATYVAYLFASNAGGFGSAGTDNVITCGSYTGNGSASGPTITLGYEPQWIMLKRASGGAGFWVMIDSMRGFINSTVATPSDAYLVANSSAAEQTWGSFTGVDNAAIPLATGFKIATDFAYLNNSGDTYIYIAIRRGPMATPTDATKVFLPATRTGTGANATVTTTVSPVDMVWSFATNGGVGEETIDFDRLRGALQAVYVTTAAEFSAADTLTGFDVQNGYRLGSDSAGYGINYSTIPFVNYSFKRAPSFFDEVCYTGTGTYPFNINHNLGVVPELMIFKTRNTGGYWYTYAKSLTSPTANWYQNYMSLNVNTESLSDTTSLTTTPTSTTITAASYFAPSGTNYVVYLFATLAGVSKVGSFTGTGGTQTINCGFGAGGARWLLVKRTDSTGNWYVFDSARGFTSSSSPYLLLNSTAAQVTGNNGCYAASTGFTLTSNASATVNINGASYIFLSVA